MSYELKPGVVVTISNPVAPEKINPADYCEIRADLWPGSCEKALSFISSSPKPVIFTCRINGEGGAFSGTDDQRHTLFSKAVQKGATLLDIEVQSNVLLKQGIKEGWPILASIHNFESMIHDLPGISREFSGLCIKVLKIVPTSKKIYDLKEIYDFLHSPSHNQLPVACFAMGKSAISSRIFALSWGSFLTYTACGDPVAPGQLTIDNFVKTYKMGSNQSSHIAITGKPELTTIISKELNLLSKDFNLPVFFIPYPETNLETEKNILLEFCPRGSITIKDIPGANVYSLQCVKRHDKEKARLTRFKSSNKPFDRQKTLKQVLKFFACASS